MKKNKAIDVILDILIGVLGVICVALLSLRIFFIKVEVNGTSMTPTIDDNSKGYMLKVNDNTKIKRFDVVAADYNEAEDYYIIKRVLGLPNETVVLTNNTLYVNGEEVEQTFDFIPRSYDFTSTSWTLLENQYLIVGDNRAGTIAPKVVKKEDMLSINGFSYYSPEGKGWYLFKYGK